MVKSRWISTIALGATFFALSVIALGAFTRLIDAGLGCPDWPGCYGQLVAPATPFVAYKAWAEMIHRYFAGTLSVLIVCLVIALFNKKYRTRGNILLAIGLLLLIAYQILLGQLTVTLKLLPIIVTQHLLGGFLILSTLWLVYLNNKSTSFAVDKWIPASAGMTSRGIASIFPWAVIGLILVLLQISLGAWTSTNYASLSCPDFPFCMNNQALVLDFKQAFNLFSPVGINYEGGVLPQAVRQTIQMAHRFGALILTSYWLILVAGSFSRLKQSAELMRCIYLIVALLFVQICIGMANVVFKLPLITAVGHNLVAVILLLATITLVFKLAVIRRQARSI